MRESKWYGIKKLIKHKKPDGETEEHKRYKTYGK